MDQQHMNVCDLKIPYEYKLQQKYRQPLKCYIGVVKSVPNFHRKENDFQNRV